VVGDVGIRATDQTGLYTIILDPGPVIPAKCITTHNGRIPDKHMHHPARTQKSGKTVNNTYNTTSLAKIIRMIGEGPRSL
jgi:hypothetical protein